MYHEYSEWRRVYCIFSKKLYNSSEKRRGVLYKRTLDASDYGKHLIFHDYITEKQYFKRKLNGTHITKSFTEHK